jgi:serine/threonine-protein kinase
MAPEQIAGDPVDHRADIYALGCVLHFALTGRPPFPRDNDMAKLFAHGNAPRPRPSDAVPSLPGTLDRVVAQAMAVDPAQRYANAGQLAADLERVVRGAEPLARETATQEPLPDQTVTRRLERPRRRRWAAILGALGAIAVAAAIVAATLILLDDGSPGNPQPHAVDTVSVGREPTRLAVAPSRLWVASTGASAIYAVDLVDDGQAHAPVPTGGRPLSVGVGFHSVWALNKGTNALLRLNPPNAPIEIPVGSEPTDMAFDDHGVWVVNRDDATVSRIDPEKNVVDATVKVGPGPTAIATGAGAVWVTSTVDRSLTKIDPGRAAVVGKPIPVGRHPNQVTVGLGYVWVTDPATGTLSKIGPETMHTVGHPIDVGERPTAVATGVGYVWVANGADSTVSRIDPRSETAAGPPIGVGQDPVDVIVGKGAVWTADFGDSSVTRIRP